MPIAHPALREALGELPNPMGLAGIEFIEFATNRPQALGQVLELMGFRPVARHRAREVLLYRQGDMNLVINASTPPELAGWPAAQHPPAGQPHAGAAPTDAASPPSMSAIGLRVRDAGAAYARALARGAWAVPTQVQVMELNIPAIHGVGSSRIYFIDRWQDFSIWDVDFVPIPSVDQHPPALGGLHWFGIVQYIGAGRTADWAAFYSALFGFAELSDAQRFGILPKGHILQSPCRTFYLQLIEPEPGVPVRPGADDEGLQRLGLGVPDVATAVQLLSARGVGFVDSGVLQHNPRGALTRTWLGSVMFELVCTAPAPAETAVPQAAGAHGAGA